MSAFEQKATKRISRRREGTVVHHIINDADLENGGAQKIVRLLHTGLRDRGINSRLISVVPSDGNGIAEYRSLGLSRPYDFRAVWRLVRYLRRECDPGDVIHAHLFPTMLYISVAARLARWRGRLVCTEHSTHNRRRNTARGRVIDGLLYSRYDRIACISGGTREALAAWMPRFASKMVVVQNGTPLAFEHTSSRPGREKCIVVSAGRLSKPKNYDTALQAMAMLRDKSFEYRIAGVGPEENELRHLCVDLKISDRVRFLGFVEDIPQLLREADIFLMPSRWEGFGLAAVEAMNAGLPVVASDVEGLREIVGTDPPCGVFCDPLEPASIASAVKELLTDPEKRRRYGNNGHKRSFQFSADAMVEKYLEFYRSL